MTTRYRSRVNGALFLMCCNHTSRSISRLSTPVFVKKSVTFGNIRCIGRSVFLRLKLRHFYLNLHFVKSRNVSLKLLHLRVKMQCLGVKLRRFLWNYNVCMWNYDILLSNCDVCPWICDVCVKFFFKIARFACAIAVFCIKIATFLCGIAVFRNSPNVFWTAFLRYF